MIDIQKLTDKDKGRFVVYKSYRENERGRIKSFNDKFVFVVYKCNEDWANFANYTGEPTSPEDLQFELTLEDLKAMQEYEQFASGIIEDSEDGLNMAGTNQMLKWVACRGLIHDWTIYVHFAYYSNQFVHDYGDKVTSRENILKLVPCDAEAFAMYRY